MNKISALLLFITVFVLCTSQLVTFSIAQPKDNKNSFSPSQITASVGDVAFFDSSSEERIWYGTPNQEVYVEVQIYGPLSSKIQIDVRREIYLWSNSNLGEFNTAETEIINSGEEDVYHTSSFMLDSSYDYNFGNSEIWDLYTYYVRVHIQSGNGWKTIYDGEDTTLYSGRLSMLDPYSNDYDRDSLSDGYELFDGVTLFNDSDTDDDGLKDGIEVTTRGFDPLVPDTDGDGFYDGYEYVYGFDPMLDDRFLDLDLDGLTNLEEYNLGTYPNDVDTDNDGMDDNYEVIYGLDPTTYDARYDFDNDGLTNLVEYIHNTDPYSKDTDGDGLNDSYEVNVLETNPNNIDTDGDGLNDSYEADEPMFDPNNLDSDGDGINDGEEASNLISGISFHLSSLLLFSPVALAATLILVKRARSKSKTNKI